MERSSNPGCVLVWMMSLLVAYIQGQVVGTPSTAAVMDASGSPSTADDMVTQPSVEGTVSSESVLNTILANVTPLPTSTQANQEGSIVTSPGITSASAISTSTMAPPQSEERNDITEDVNVLHSSSLIPDVPVTTSSTTTSTIAPTAPPSSAAPTSPAVSTVAPLPMPEVSTTSPPEIVPTTTTTVGIPTQPSVISSSTAPASATVASSSSSVSNVIIYTTRDPKSMDRENIILVDNEVETDVNDTLLWVINSTALTEEDNATESSSDYDLETVTTIPNEEEEPITLTTVPTDDRSAIDSLVQAACEKEMRIDTVVVLAVVVIVNVISVVVTALCVYRVVKRHLSWDPPPLSFPKGNNRSGLDLASDEDCKSGECGGTNIPIIITNEDGWCVPYSENDVKKTK
ncbi:unnamed protein product, partial [Meganyctiphanes norvegica]